MAQIEEKKEQKKVTDVLINAVKVYFGFAALVLFATVPTKAIYLLAKFLWNII